MMSSRVGRESRKRFLGKLTPGDHIATIRKGEIYEHHGIFKGDDRIIHFQGPSKGQVQQHVCKNCDYCPSQTGGIVHTCFKCFCLRESCFIIRYKMHDGDHTGEDVDLSDMDNFVAGKAIQGYKSNQIYLELFVDGVLQGHKKIPKGERSKYEFDDEVKLCKFSSFRSVEEVLKTASSCSSRFRKYNLLLNNCEDFAVFCKTGKAASIQVKNKFGILYEPAKRMHYFGLQRGMYEELRRRLARSNSEGSSSNGSDAEVQERDNQSGRKPSGRDGGLNSGRKPSAILQIERRHQDDEMLQEETSARFKPTQGRNNNLVVEELGSCSKDPENHPLPLPAQPIIKMHKQSPEPEFKMDYVFGEDDSTLSKKDHSTIKQLIEEETWYETASSFLDTTIKSDDSESLQADMEVHSSGVKRQDIEFKPADEISYRRRNRVIIETDVHGSIRSLDYATLKSMRQDFNSMARSFKELQQTISFLGNIVTVGLIVLFLLVARWYWRSWFVRL